MTQDQTELEKIEAAFGNHSIPLDDYIKIVDAIQQLITEARIEELQELWDESLKTTDLRAERRFALLHAEIVNRHQALQQSTEAPKKSVMDMDGVDDRRDGSGKDE